ncbi:MAG: DUF2950 domain-containing protein [Azonexus sp.]
MSNRWMKGAAALLFTLVLSAPCAAAGTQKTFASPEIALEALVDSLARNDDAEMRAILGLKYDYLLPLNNLTAEDRLVFLGAWAKGHRILRDSDTVARLEVSSGWTLPIPLVRTANGWVFDTRAGKEEMRTRRIGRNELAAIETMRAYVEAQREYAAQDRNSDGIREFAQKILSSPGKQDGLSWPTPPGEPESPAGPLLETKDLKDGYHGYRFRILKAQGKAAPGGARSYVKDGRMTEGFALIGWPARYGETGLMTFVVNQDGIVYQKHLWPNSAAIAGAMTRFDPDPSWTALPTP